MRRLLLQGVVSLALVGELFAAPTEAPAPAPAPPPAFVPTSDIPGYSADERQRAAENINFINAVLQDLIKRRDDPAIKDNVLMYRCLTAYVNKVRALSVRGGSVLRGEKPPSTTDPADKFFGQSKIEARQLSEEAKGCLGNPETNPNAVVPSGPNVPPPPEAEMPVPLVPERAPFASPVY